MILNCLLILGWRAFIVDYAGIKHMCQLKLAKEYWMFASSV